MPTCPSCGLQVEGSPKFCPECGGKFGSTPMGRASLVGRVLSAKYRLMRELGQGGMGTVYLAEHTGLAKRVALKVLHPDLQVSEESLQRFQREGIAAGQLGHAGAIQIFDFDKDESGLLYLAMEYVEGADLKSVVRREGPLAPDRALSITRQVLEVLAEAHAQGIVHRDLKPDNIMLLRGSGGEDKIKVLDFGLSKLIARPLDSSLMTQTGRIMGTPLYMSPEQASGLEVDSRSDIYAVGLILYEMLSGEPTFGGDSIPEILVQHTSVPPPLLTEKYPDLKLPAGIEDVLEGALEKDRSQRFQTAQEMLAALDEVDHERPEKRRRRRRVARNVSPWPWLAAGTAALALLLLAAWLVMGRGGSEARAGLVSQRPPERLSIEEARYVRHLSEARSALRDQSLDVALSAAEDAVALPSRDAEAFLVRASILRRRGERDAARADLAQALELDSGYAAALAEQGWLAIDDGDHSAARVAFSAALALDSACPPALAGEGELLRRAGSPQQARERFAEAVRHDPELASAHLALGELALEAGALEEAVGAFVAARRRAAGDWRAYAGLGRVYLAQERGVEAEKQLREALQRNPRAESARIDLATLLLAGGRSSEARELLRFPGSDGIAADLQVLLAAALAADDEPRAALEAFEPAVAAAAPPGYGALLLGQLHLEEGSAEHALAAFDEALATLDESELLPLAHLDRGLALARLERFDEALASVRGAVELAPQDLFALLTLGWLEMDWGDSEAALQHLERYRELGGGDDRVALWLSRIDRLR